MIQHAASLAEADRVLRENGKTFAWARRFLGARHAERATRLYAFCRYLDDVADETRDPAEAAAALERIRGQLDRGAAGDPMLDAVLHILGGEGPGLDAARSCYRVAGTVGVMMCHALDRPDPAALPHAIDLGVGMQLTNIARDIHEDAGLGRRYVPATLAGDLAPEAILDPTEEQRRALAGARRRLLELADDYYRSGERGLSFLPLRARGAILVAAETYRAIGPRALALGSRLDRRAFVPGGAKARVSAAALLSATPRPSFWRRPAGHDAALHVHLDGLGGANAPEAPLG